MVRLEPMTREQFRASIESSIVRIAEENRSLGLWEGGLAEATARGEFDQLLPQGFETPGFSFWTIVDNRSGVRVGEAWSSVDTKGGRPHFWVHWLFIDPAHRRRGYARDSLEELGRRAQAAGADRIGLHVLADNAPARSLYDKMGYRPTSLRMAQRLPPRTD